MKLTQFVLVSMPPGILWLVGAKYLRLPGHWAKNCRGPSPPSETGAAFIIRAVPQLFDPVQEVLPMEAQSDGGDYVLSVWNV